MEKILVLNGSPKKLSDTMKITNSFLKGMNYNGDYQIEIINTIDCNIKPCRGCLRCLMIGDGKCSIDDEQKIILEKIKECNVLIWSFPLYCYGLPSNLKVVMDRILPLNTLKMRKDGDIIVHDTSCNMSKKKYVVISGCGFPNFEDNFKAVREQFKVFHRGEATMICISEAPMLNAKGAESLALPLLSKIEDAGKEFAINGKLSKETIKLIETPMLDNDIYMSIVNKNGA